MQYFSGRFKEKASDTILDFHSSIGFDKRLYKYDITGSIAHVKGLVKQGVITEYEGILIERSLIEIEEKIENDQIEFSTEYEDIHMNIEKILIEKIGDIGKKLHTGRSRNDQVALDMKLFTKDEIKKIQKEILVFLETLKNIAEENIKTYMPGFTHLQKAQPITFSHYILAYAEMFKRDYKRLQNAYQIMDYSPLGAVALAGTTYDLDRYYTSEILGFSGPSINSLDAVSDRDYLIEVASCLSIIMMHLSRLAEEIIIYTSNEFSYIELSDSFSTGSSIMPQKKNPDAAELVRGKTGRVYGSLISLLTTMKALPLAYNKDMQEDKEVFFDSVDTVKGCIKVFNGMLKTMKIKKETLLKSCANGFINATDVADFLVNKGLSFREAYKIVGSIVSYCIDQKKSLEELSIEEFKIFSIEFDENIYKEIEIESCVEKRKVFGGPAEGSVLKQIELLKEFIEGELE